MLNAPRVFFLRNIHGKSRKMRGKSGNFRGIHSSKWQNRREILQSFPVVFGRFRSHFRSFLDMIPNDSRFFPFSFLFIPQPHVFMLYNIKKSFISKFLAFFLAVPDFLLTFANAYKKIVINPAGWPLSPMASQPQAFFMPIKYHFPGSGKKVFSIWRLHEP